jgi:hypothetical protein
MPLYCTFCASERVDCAGGQEAIAKEQRCARTCKASGDTNGQLRALRRYKVPFPHAGFVARSRCMYFLARRA